MTASPSPLSSHTACTLAELVRERKVSPLELLDAHLKRLEQADLLRRARHTVEEADPPAASRFAVAIFARWCGGTAQDVEGLDAEKLEPRNRRHAQLGRLAQRLGLIKERDRVAWRELNARFFSRYDLLLTPALANVPLRAEPWSERSWAANFYASSRFAPFSSPWNFAGYPAAALPAGRHSSGLPLSVQLVAPDGGEGLILAAAKELETLRPWQRHAVSSSAPSSA